jgi:hypothetical protein
MNVDPADAHTIQMLRFDELQYLVLSGGSCGRQSPQQPQDLVTIHQRSACQFADDVRKHRDQIQLEQKGKGIVTFAERIDPNRSVDEYHFADRGRLRRTEDKRGCVPPSLANRRALSRAIRASRPMRTNAVFSFSPVNAAASRSISSSMFKVDLIHVKMHIGCTRVKSLLFAVSRNGRD